MRAARRVLTSPSARAIGCIAFLLFVIIDVRRREGVCAHSIACAREAMAHVAARDGHAIVDRFVAENAAEYGGSSAVETKKRLGAAALTRPGFVVACLLPPYFHLFTPVMPFYAQHAYATTAHAANTTLVFTLIERCRAMLFAMLARHFATPPARLMALIRHIDGAAPFAVFATRYALVCRARGV